MTTRLEFSFEVEPDEHGVFDGRKLARQFIGSAFALLVPYVDGCPACTDALFSKLANDVMGELNEESRKDGLTAALYTMGPEETKQERERAHLEAAEASTAELLRDHHHHDHGHNYGEH